MKNHDGSTELNIAVCSSSGSTGVIKIPALTLMPLNHLKDFSSQKLNEHYTSNEQILSDRRVDKNLKDPFCFKLIKSTTRGQVQSGCLAMI